MRRYGPAALLLLTGGAVLRITLFGDLYLRYVQAGLRPYLIVSGVALVLLGVVTAVLHHRPPGPHEDGPHEDGDHEDGDHGDGDHGDGGRGDGGHGGGARGGDGDHELGDHEGGDRAEDGVHRGGGGHEGHSHGPAGPRVAWLLTLPALALLLFPPPALGSYSAGREAAQRAAQGVGSFPALPAGNPVELTVAEFSSRAIYDSGRSLSGRTVRMTGFVTHGDDGTWYVTRLLVTCCAADATTGKVEIRDADDDVLPADTWVTVTGTWRPKGSLGSDAAWPPALDAATVTRVKQPADPYEKA
ncbi:TIGR03943 family putative permease subunit [Streptomyces maremycinicus]|uniref:TIGR03943 family putative permease subunit n=1 Tax=Streptomyces maremycinicus TaxID=1679753 RepID=UPI000786D93B|nr:TIGR03943 family protein [Streptomyces sp. NBRC 110468]